ncbi:nickel-dependent hydrogenase large subunit [soil metagenome]
MADASLDWLAGTLTVRPGLAAPGNLLNTRPDWVARLTQGKPAKVLPDLLSSLFNLCGQAHRLCACLALQAAEGQTEALADAARCALQTETLREHLRRICLDWPRQLAETPDASCRTQTLALKDLQACPLSMGAFPAGKTLDLPSLQAWLEQQLLGMPAWQWLRQWECNPHGFMIEWCASTPLWLPELLHGCKSVADLAMTGAPALQVHASRQDLQALAGDLRSTPSFTRQPLWRGHCAETGPWTRLNQHAPERFDTPWLRLGAKLAELVRLALPDEAGHSGSCWLQAGSICLGNNEGLAWIEMARGLLIHSVQLDGQGNDARVLACHVVAPTEWNFHSQGAVAQVLATLPSRLTPQLEQRILVLMAAFDPCVRFELSLSALPKEKCDA